MSDSLHLLYTYGVLERIRNMVSSAAEKELEEDMEGVFSELRSVYQLVFGCITSGYGGEAYEVINCLRRIRTIAYDIEDQVEIKQLYQPEVRPSLRGYSCNLADSIAQLRQSLSELLVVVDRYRTADLQSRSFCILPDTLEASSLSGKGASFRYYGGIWSLPDGETIVGLDSMKEEIIQWIFNDDQSNLQRPKIISIEGEAGVGKTTLAKMIYNYAASQASASFDLLLWALAPPTTSDLRGILVEIIRSSTNQSQSSCLQITDELGSLEYKLRGILGGRKYLLVLDDYSEEVHDDYVGEHNDYLRWERLMKMFDVGSEGSTVILVSAEPVSVATKRWELQGLSESDSWSLFAQSAGFDEKACYPLLTRSARCIVDSCDGCPLAIKTLGSMLRYSRDEDSWVEVMESNIMKSSTTHTAATNAFKFSVEHMSGGLLQCLYASSVMSKSKVVPKDQLIYYWMAQGLLQSRDGNEDPIDKGSRYCDELASRCFVELFQSDGRTMVLLHQQVASLQKTLGWVEDCSYLNLCGDGSLSNYKFDPQNSIQPNVRAFQFQNCVGPVKEFFLEDIISKFNNLRVLFLDGSEFEKLPESIGRLKLLSHLSLAGNNNLKGLPDFICKLRNLRILYLSGCKKLQTLPKNMEKLVNLRYLSLSFNPTNLPELTVLHHLKICSSPIVKTFSKELALLTALKVLEIHDCPSMTSLPNTIWGLPSLSELSILNCERLDLTNWYGFRGLRGLRYLQIHNLPKLRKLPEGFCSAANSLRHLNVSDCQSLIYLPEDLKKCMYLTEVVIDNCPALTTLPKGIYEINTLQVLKIINCPKLRSQKEAGDDRLQHPSYLKRGYVQEPTRESHPKIWNLHRSGIGGEDVQPKLPKPNYQILMEEYQSKIEVVRTTRGRKKFQRTPNFSSPDELHFSRFSIFNQTRSRGFPIALVIVSLTLAIVAQTMPTRNGEVDKGNWSTVVLLIVVLLIVVFTSRARDAMSPVYEVCQYGFQILRAQSQVYGLELYKRFAKQIIGSSKEILLLMGEGCEFEKDQLIQLWMAAGHIILEPMEIIGAHYFEILIFEGYILPSHSDLLYKVNIKKLKSDMDMIRNKSHYLRLESALHSTNVAPKKILHLSVAGNSTNDTIFKTLPKFKWLKTLIFQCTSGIRLDEIPVDIFSSFKALAVLDLSRTSIKEMPSSVSGMIHLRYLDSSWTRIEFLPESIGRLQKLQTLRLKGCSHLWSLPAGIARLTELRHLDFNILGQLGAVPKGMGVLVRLRTLSAFIVGDQEGSKITELRDLSNLTGEFCIAKLEHVESARDAEMACLNSKKSLKRLELRWSDFPLQETKNQDVVDDVLEKLCPHSDLEELLIRCYGGATFPSWIGFDSLPKLSSITLFKCKYVSVLPALQKMPLLEYLGLFGLSCLRKMKFKGETNQVAFPKLRKLVIDEMLNLYSWEEGGECDFPCLEDVTIKHCPKLLELPTLVLCSSLKRLELGGCPEIRFGVDNEVPSSLEFLSVEDCPSVHVSQLKKEGKLKHVPYVWCDQEANSDKEEEEEEEED